MHVLSLSSLRFGGIGRGWTGRGVWGSPASLCQAVVAILSQARALITTLLTARYALPTPPTIFTPNLPLAPGSLVIREGYRGGGGAGIVNAAEWFLLLAPQGRRVLSHPGKVSPFGPSSQPSPFLGVHVRKKKSIPPAKCLHAQCVSTRTRRARVCVSARTYRQSNCSFSIVPLPSRFHPSCTWPSCSVK